MKEEGTKEEGAEEQGAKEGEWGGAPRVLAVVLSTLAWRKTQYKAQACR